MKYPYHINMKSLFQLYIINIIYCWYQNYDLAFYYFIYLQKLNIILNGYS